MPQSAVPQAVQQALEHLRAGRIAEALALLEQVLAVQPEHAAALYLSGIAHHQAGRNDAAADLLRRAIAHNPANAEFLSAYAEICTARGELSEAVDACLRAIGVAPAFAPAHNSLGTALRDQGKLDEAIAAYSRAIQCRPQFAEAVSNLGTALQLAGKHDEAAAAFSRAIQIKPGLGILYFNLGNALRAQGKAGDAIAAYSKCIELNPGQPDAYNNLGIVLSDSGRLDDAVHAYARAVQIAPDYADAYNNLGSALQEQRRFDEAAAAFARAIAARPDYAEAYYNLANALGEQRKFDAAAEAYLKAIQLKPDFAEAHNNLANVRKEQGRLDEALQGYDRAAQLAPQNSHYFSNRQLAIYYHPGFDSAAILREQREWDRRFGNPSRQDIRGQDARHAREGASGGAARLRIGYVSPDFRDHALGYSLLPLFREHDHARFEIFGFSDVRRPDDLTRRFQAYCDVWRNTRDLDHDALAAQIHNDRIDILVDLTMHGSDNRLALFARKPVPVQVTFGAYPGGTGLAAIDYRLTDPWLDLPGISDGDYVERSIRLPDTYWCFDPSLLAVGAAGAHSESPAVCPLPAIANGQVTFGSLNNFCKINDAVLALWARVLGAVAGSRLLLLADEGSHRRRLLDRLEAGGVRADRVDFLPRRPRLQYLQYYHGVDIGLDSFPYNGHMTSLDSYWMGVPVITLVGATVVGRAGLSQLTNLGLPELAAKTPEEFVEIARGLASDLPRLAELRAGLRERMRQSPLADAPRFARNVEAAYMEIWRRISSTAGRPA